MKPYLMLMLLLGIMSCRQDIGVQLPFDGPRLVVISLLSPDKPFSARVEPTYPPTGKTVFDTAFARAVVTVYQNNRPIDTLQYRRGNLYESGRGLKPQTGQTYRLRITAPGFPDAESRDEVVPPAPRGSRATIEKPENYVITGALDDIPNQVNQYSIQLTGLYQGMRVPASTNNLSRPDEIRDNCGFRGNHETFFYRDACFTNQQLTARFGSSLVGTAQELLSDKEPFVSPNRLSDKVLVQTRTITDSYWQYYRYVSSDGIEQAFAQPATRYTNLRGGCGIVAAYHEQATLLNVEP